MNKIEKERRSRMCRNMTAIVLEQTSWSKTRLAEEQGVTPSAITQRSTGSTLLTPTIFKDYRRVVALETIRKHMPQVFDRAMDEADKILAKGGA
jgi:hypothetical protein